MIIRLRPFLSELTSIHLGGHAICELIVEKWEDLEALPDKVAQYGGKPFFIGKGSNLLARDGDLDLTLVRIQTQGEPEIISEDNDKALVRVGAGMPLARLMRFCLRHGLSGLEGLMGVPGSVGGAVMMNASSFGSETAQSLDEVEVWADNKIKTYKSNKIKSAYRHCQIGAEELPLVLSATFTLTKRPKGVIFTYMNLNFIKKKSRQPLQAWSAGCAFKNPPDNSAGRLLDQCGFRGRAKGGMAFSGQHANFLVNTGNGSASAALDLLAEAKEAVYIRHGIKLETEIRLVS